MINDKALDELVKRGRGVLDRCSRYLQGHGGALFSIPANGEDVDLTIDDLLNAITALRAERDGWRTRQQETQQFLDMIAEKARNARQVTREQRNAAIAIAIGKAKQMEGAATYGQVFDWFAEQLGLEIVEETPQAEGRECRCDFAPNGEIFCDKTHRLEKRRCTIREGERDETR